MKQLLILIVFTVTLVAGNRTANAQTYFNTYNGVNYSSDHPYNLNVVYFLPNDMTLDPTYKKRLSALLIYAQNFYKQNMINNGYGAKTFGLFKETAHPDSVKIILLNAAHPHNYYSYANGSTTASEVDAYFANNPTQKASQHTLVISAVSDINNANVPFYGTGKTCYALDYPDMDIKYINTWDTKGNLFVQWFGGLMHELGHGLNLDHSRQTTTENNNPTKGMNLMSVGNGTLGREPTFINRAGCAVLNNCEVFASAPGISRYNGHKSLLTRLHAVYNNGNLTVSGTYKSDKPVTDVNIYQDPNAQPSQGYYKVAWSVAPGAGNSFSVTMPVNELATSFGNHNLQIELVLQNGETSFNYYPFSYNNGIPTINVNFDDDASCDALPATWQVAQVGSTDAGKVCYDASNNNFRIKSYSTGWTDQTDNFPFVYTSMTGDVTIVAKVKDVTTNWNDASGIMMRSNLSPNSAFVCINALDTRGVFDLYRPVNGGNTAYNSTATNALPVWLKLQRTGNTIHAYYSSDNYNWTLKRTYNVSMGNEIYVGLAVSQFATTSNISNVMINDVMIGNVQPGNKTCGTPNTTTTTSSPWNTFSTAGPVSQSFGLWYSGNTFYVEHYNRGVVTTGTGSNNIQFLSQGTSIGSSSTWSTGNSQSVLYSPTYTSLNNQTGYVGIRMQQNGNTYYGWMKISVSSTSGIKCLEYQYNKTPNAPIVAGATCNDGSGTNPSSGNRTCGTPNTITTASSPWNTFLTTGTVSQYYGLWYSGSTFYVEHYSRGVVTTGTGSNNIQFLSQGTNIGSSSTWGTGNSQSVLYSPTYTSLNNQTGYVGIRMQQNGNTYYGWMKISVSSTNGIKCLEYQYNETPDQSILAGSACSVNTIAGFKNVSPFSVNVFPNPVSEQLFIRVSDMQGHGRINIVDVTGRTVATDIVKEPGLHTISVDHITAGIYFVQYQDNTHKETIKINKL